ncbi:MAG: RlpA-like double-psi beta-barrel domain-containing protein [Chitinophagaceae bacterium]
MLRINDRGPFVAGRIIDLSRAAAKEIGMIQSGVVKVKISYKKKKSSKK